MAQVKLKNLRKVFDVPGSKEVAVDGVHTTIKDEQLTTIVGPSGCGKTTLLRMIAGLETPTEGKIDFDGKDTTKVTPQNRGVSMVFQSIALFPYMSVRKNIAYGLKYEDVPSEQVETQVEEMAEMLGIAELLDKKPGQLSGGQQQRVALGRALIRDPEVFLLDEPMSKLDERIRTRLRSELKELQKKLSTTSVYVTHNQEQAMTLSDEIIIMNDGKIEQQGTPSEVFHEPVNTFVAGFIGSPNMNLFEAEIGNGELVVPNSTLRLDIPPSVLPEAESSMQNITMGIRPSRLQVSTDPSVGPLQGTVSIVERLGNNNILHIDNDDLDCDLQAVTTNLNISEDDSLGISLDLSDVHLFNWETGEAITHGIKEPSSNITSPEGVSS